MEDIPDKDESEPRTGDFFNGVAQRFTPLLLIPYSVPDLILLVVLLLIALASSVLRASLSASAALENPWMKKSQEKLPGKKERFALLIIQYVCMLLGWIVAANFFLKTNSEISRALYSFAGLVSGWLILEAILRWYSTRNAVGLTELGSLNKAILLLGPMGGFFLSIGSFFGVAHKESPDQWENHTNGENGDMIEEKEILLGVASIGKTTAREAMVSKSNIKACSIDIDFHELMDLVNKFGYSRMPVYKENLDNIEGILLIKDLLPHIQKDENFAWQELVKEPYLIPETKRLDGLLEEFQKRRVHMAIVIDEYGNTKGLITLEDIIEEIFGEISDEHDDENVNKFVRIDERNYVFEGQALLNDVIRTLELDGDYFDELRIESETLAGLILELFTRVPNIGEEVNFKDLTLKVQAATKKQVRKIRVTLPEDWQD